MSEWTIPFRPERKQLHGGHDRDAGGTELRRAQPRLGRSIAKAGASALYRAPTREWAGLVQIVHGQSRQHSVVCVQAVVDEIIVPTTENDRRGLRKYGGILDGNDNLSPPSPVPERLTLVTSEPVLSVQDAGPGTAAMFCSQVLPHMT